jgi:hypothetical protein
MRTTKTVLTTLSSLTPPLPGRDAIESCANCEDAEATACFAYFGCDRHRVERWYNVVAGLEQTLATPGAHTARPPFSAPRLVLRTLLDLQQPAHLTATSVQYAALSLRHVPVFNCTTG